MIEMGERLYYKMINLLLVNKGTYKDYSGLVLVCNLDNWTPPKDQMSPCNILVWWKI